MSRGQRRFWGEWYPAREKHAPPAHGVKVTKIGATWWGKRWIDGLERIAGWANRLPRGRTYARAGRVHDLEIAAGGVSARVTGSSRRPYEITIAIPVLDERTWKKAIAAMAQQAVFSAELLSGQMPKEIDAAFARAKSSLFPRAEHELDTDCSCPDWANPCKHIAATHYVLGEAFDRDPFLLFELRGKRKEQVLAELRELRVGAKTARVPVIRAASLPLTDRRAAGYERAAAPIASMRFRLAAPSVAASVLVQLGAPPSWGLAESPAELLADLYAAASARAVELAAQGEGVRPARGSEPA